MIAAKEALRLPTAQLSATEVEDANKLEAEIEESVINSMERRGCDLTTSQTNGNVIAEVNQRLKRAGYLPQWRPLVEKHKLDATIQQHVGFQLSLAPSDDAYGQPFVH